MIDPNFIHQRDVSTILTNLQNDVNNVRERYAENPNDPQLAIELQKLIDNADRDLRLKTQAIVRARLSQSRLLPIQSKSIPPPELPPRSHSVAGSGPPLPPLQPVPNDYEPSNPHKRATGHKNSQPPQPIQPIVHDKHPKVIAAHISKEKPGRPRRIPMQKETLPKIDKHDPLAPPPPISEKLINTYGLEQLNETGLIQNSDIKKHLEGIVTVAPFTYELPPVPLSVNPNYVLDTSNQNNDEIQNRPNSREKPSTPTEETNNQEENKATQLNKSNSLESNEIDEKTKIFNLINGIPDEDSIGYINFRQLSFNLSDSIDIYMELLRRLCEENGLKQQKIDGQKLIELASVYDPDEVSEDRLFGCFVGNMKKIKKAGRFGFGFIGPGAEKKAAIAIQSIWRGFLARRLVRFIKRTSSAAKKIQTWYRQKNDIYKFNQSIRDAKKERYQTFLTLQKTDFYYPDQPHLLLHIIDGHLPSELGRIQALKSNKNATLAIFSRFPLPTVIASYLKDHVEDQERLVFVVPKQKLPYTLPIEDVLASDLRLMKQIQEIAEDNPIFLVPNRMRDSLVDVGSFMKSYMIAPLSSALKKVQGLKNNRDFLSIGCKNLFTTSQDEIFNKDDLCANLADLSLSNLMTQQWFIRSNSGKFAWIDSDEIPILDKMRKNAKILTQNDLEDPTFKNLLIKTISDNLEKITNTISTTNKNDFLKDALNFGAVVQAAPQNVKSRTSVSLFVNTRRKNKKIVSNKKTQNETEKSKEKVESNENKEKVESNESKEKVESNEKVQNEENESKEKVESLNQTQNDKEKPIENENNNKEEEEENNDEFDGEVHITGTWENLYISEFEKFATIHPAFIVKPERLRKHAMKYADEMIKRNLIGSSVIDFWASEHNDKDRLTPDNIDFIATERCLSQNLSENVCNLKFNEKHLKMGRYTYVQDRLVLPYEMSTTDFNQKCIENGIKLNKNVFFLPDLQEEITIGFVAVADTPELLINLVYETFCILSEKVFDLKNDPHALLFSYCTAIEYLKDQIDSESGITNTVFMKKMKVKVVDDQIKPLLFNFDDIKKQDKQNDNKVSDDDDDKFDEMLKFVNDEKIAENTSSNSKSSTVKILSDDYIPEGRRSLLTTPVDANGRERKLITCEEENQELINMNNHILKPVKEDLPDAPAGANISDEPEESFVENKNDEQVKSEEIKDESDGQEENDEQVKSEEIKDINDENDRQGENDGQDRIEGNDDEILTEEAVTPRSDDED